ncbi:hypothetical protein P7K49_037349 [Saguinus oedipus]|uniref:Uncharacterized protein n=1 Tax=Saguinus oedipus TaxID=9490 RepID=A0ABQ9THV0_SAGOE|nr:hypothetical protein P7K49_037349 [Saguinus oedipus]
MGWQPQKENLLLSGIIMGRSQAKGKEAPCISMVSFDQKMKVELQNEIKFNISGHKEQRSSRKQTHQVLQGRSVLGYQKFRSRTAGNLFIGPATPPSRKWNCLKLGWSSNVPTKMQMYP